MFFENQRNAFTVSGTPWLGIEGARNLVDGESFEFLELDLTGEDLSLFLSKAPGLVALAELPVEVLVNATTWGDVLIPCNEERYLPCGVELIDATVTSTVTVSWDETNFATVPEADEPNDVLPLYMELRRTDGSGPRIAGGVFYLTETNKNGDT